MKKRNLLVLQISRDDTPGSRPQDPYCLRVTSRFDLTRTANNFRFSTNMPRRCVLGTCVVIQTEMVSCSTNGRNAISWSEIGQGLSEITRVWIGPTNCLLLCSEYVTEQCYETTEMARSCGYLPRLREDAIPTIKRKKQSTLETVTPSLPSYQHMYTDNLSGESNTCCHCPEVTTRAPENNYLFSTQISTNEMNHHLFSWRESMDVSSTPR